MAVIKYEVPARAGLIGNPSDGYNGKTIAVPVRNFHAEVRLWEIPDKIVLPKDENEFSSIEDLVEHTSTKGFYDAGRLVKAAVTVFYEYLKKQKTETNRKRFEIDYRTNIPRMVGLSGSSAIITGTMRCLQDLYNEKISPELLANYILESEKIKLGIPAGLQDRVVQSYDDLVYMDFSEQAFEMNKNEHGTYEVLDKHILPNLFLLYHAHPSESGKIHSDITSRFFDPNPEISNPIKQAMRKFGSLTDEFKEALLDKDYAKCMKLQNENFDLRKNLYGEEAIGKDNLKMIDIARSTGCSAKFSGSGGAIVGIYPNESYFQEMKEKIKNTPYELIRIIF